MEISEFFGWYRASQNFNIHTHEANGREKEREKNPETRTTANCTLHVYYASVHIHTWDNVFIYGLTCRANKENYFVLQIVLTISIHITHMHLHYADENFCSSTNDTIVYLYNILA